MEKIIKNLNAHELGIFVFIGGFVVGVLVSSYVDIHWAVALMGFLLALATLSGEKILYSKLSQAVLITSLLIVSVALGSLRYEIKDFHKTDSTLEKSVEEKIIFEGIVTNESEKRDNATRIVVRPNESKDKILVSTDLYNHSVYGDLVKVTGKLQKPGIIEGEDGRNFDYAKYLSKDDIYYTISFAQVEIISADHGNPLKAFLYKTKRLFTEKIRSILPEPESSLLAGLILAGKESLSANILEEFRRSGIVHIVVLSGYNVTIIAEFFLKIFGFLALKAAAISSAGAIILFTLMTGASATVVRASIMALTLLLGKIIGRNYSAPRALLVAGFFMLLENPKILAYDTSFKLSFLATLALIYISPIFEKYLLWVTDKGGLRSISATTVSTQLIVLPYLLYSMGNFSVVSLVSNILVLTFIPITMLAGFVSTLLGFVHNIIAIPFAYVAHLLLSWILLVAEKLGNLSWGSIEVRAFPFWVVIVWYLVYLTLFIQIRMKTEKPLVN